MGVRPVPVATGCIAEIGCLDRYRDKNGRRREQPWNRSRSLYAIAGLRAYDLEERKSAAALDAAQDVADMLQGTYGQNRTRRPFRDPRRTFGSRLLRRLVRLARARTRRPQPGARPARALVAGRREPGLEGADGRPFHAHRAGRPRLPADRGRRRGHAPGARGLPRREHRSRCAGSIDSTSTRATSRRIAWAGPRPSAIPPRATSTPSASAARCWPSTPTASFSGSARSPKTSVSSRLTADAPCPPFSRETPSSSAVSARAGEPTPAGPIASSPSTNAPARRSGWPPREAVPSTPPTPRRSPRSSTGCAC